VEKKILSKKKSMYFASVDTVNRVQELRSRCINYHANSKNCVIFFIILSFLGDSELYRTSLWKITFDKDYATIDTLMTL
jgi:hypothetical protein